MLLLLLLSTQAGTYFIFDAIEDASDKADSKENNKKGGGKKK